MNYANYVRDLCKTSRGRIYLYMLALKLKEDKDKKSLQYLVACISSSGDSDDIISLSAKAKCLLDELNWEQEREEDFDGE